MENYDVPKFIKLEKNNTLLLNPNGLKERQYRLYFFIRNKTAKINSPFKNQTKTKNTSVENSSLHHKKLQWFES